MNFLLGILRNRFFIVGVSSWFVAQLLKTILYAIENKKWDWSRLFGDGGMPSGHSATVTSLSAFCGLSFGFGSFQFAVTAILAIIVCHDAMGVRLETGKQAEVINELTKTIELLSSKEWTQEKLKEFVGHTPIQVLAGILLGIVNALVMYFFIFN